MIGRARYQNTSTVTLLNCWLRLDFSGIKKVINKHSSSLWGFLLRKLIEHLVLFTKAVSMQCYTLNLQYYFI